MLKDDILHVIWVIDIQIILYASIIMDDHYSQETIVYLFKKRYTYMYIDV